MKKLRLLIFLFISAALSGCAGTIKTMKSPDFGGDYKKAYILAAESSQYIKSSPGVVVPIPFGAIYVAPIEKAPESREAIGNTAEVIRQELGKYGIWAEIVKYGEIPDDFDLLVVYEDTWRWDLKKIMDKLEIAFISPEGKVIGISTYKIRSNELHNFPSPEKEVPKMIKELLAQ